VFNELIKFIEINIGKKLGSEIAQRNPSFTLSLSESRARRETGI